MHFFNPLFFGLSTKVLPVSSLKLSLSWGPDSSASLESLVLFATMIRTDGVPIDGAGVGDWVRIRWETVGRQLRGKKSGVDSDLRWRQTSGGRLARAVGLRAWIRTRILYKELARLGVREGPAIVGTKAAGRHRVMFFAARTLKSIL